MQAEENLFSVDYDVWIDEKTERTIIEKYTGHLEASTCENCGFATMRLVKEEAIQSNSIHYQPIRKKLGNTIVVLTVIEPKKMRSYSKEGIQR